MTDAMGFSARWTQQTMQAHSVLWWRWLSECPPLMADPASDFMGHPWSQKIKLKVTTTPGHSDHCYGLGIGQSFLIFVCCLCKWRWWSRIFAFFYYSLCHALISQSWSRSKMAGNAQGSGCNSAIFCQSPRTELGQESASLYFVGSTHRPWSRDQTWIVWCPMVRTFLWSKCEDISENLGK